LYISSFVTDNDRTDVIEADDDDDVVDSISRFRFFTLFADSSFWSVLCCGGKFKISGDLPASIAAVSYTKAASMALSYVPSPFCQPLSEICATYLPLALKITPKYPEALVELIFRFLFVFSGCLNVFCFLPLFVCCLLDPKLVFVFSAGTADEEEDDVDDDNEDDDDDDDKDEDEEAVELSSRSILFNILVNL